MNDRILAQAKNVIRAIETDAVSGHAPASPYTSVRKNAKLHKSLLSAAQSVKAQLVAAVESADIVGLWDISMSYPNTLANACPRGDAARQLHVLNGVIVAAIEESGVCGSDAFGPLPVSTLGGLRLMEALRSL